MRRFCEALPADRLLQGDDYDLDTALAKEKSYRKYVDPETGATLTYASSLIVLAHFVGCLVSALRSLKAAIADTSSRTVTRTSPIRLHTAFLFKTRSSCVKLYFLKVPLSTVLQADLRPRKPLHDDRLPSKHVSSFDKAVIWTRICYRRIIKPCRTCGMPISL